MNLDNGNVITYEEKEKLFRKLREGDKDCSIDKLNKINVCLMQKDIQYLMKLIFKDMERDEFTKMLHEIM